MREKLTHFDEKGNAVMVDVSEKEVTSRVAVASGKIRVNAKVMEAVKKGTSKKGDVLPCTCAWGGTCGGNHGGQADGESDSNVSYTSDQQMRDCL